MKDNETTYKMFSILILGVGLMMFERGFFWTKEQNDVLDDSDFYMALHQIMPIWMWGVMGMIFSILIIIAPFFLPKQHLNNKFNYLCLIGGTGNGIFYFLMTSASIYNAINWLTPLQFATFTTINILIAFYGGAAVVRKR
ncbi:hypothetical protein BUY42_00145 [Staphylococcus devriesei]|uniref:Uncharacterized protein n=1 Tax=Staphylococcus devriesei TaxID=586733 RepID=A0ABX5HZM2_9STAP|nr:hypothetical protein [Staphylococcus devriesei]PTF04597.1 hypothetical protein BUY45_03480 [Staphylococcus devriesei]PTF13135.1 hypothetical protein BUY47_10235 [Staphylococcus devriesei]PTF20426.1 hypothetical protein BUY42_00145 [Staphylococcus devriesei]